MERYKKLASQLGKRPKFGSVMTDSLTQALKKKRKNNSTSKPMKSGSFNQKTNTYGHPVDGEEENK